MNSNLIVGALAFVALVAFFAANLKAAQELKLMGSQAARGISGPQKLLWRVTGNAEQFLLAVFVVELALLLIGGWISLRPGDPIRTSWWGVLYFGILAAGGIYGVLKAGKR
jgi:hypothetical protein